jgi:hypothetical protein
MKWDFAFTILVAGLLAHSADTATTSLNVCRQRKWYRLRTAHGRLLHATNLRESEPTTALQPKGPLSTNFVKKLIL